MLASRFEQMEKREHITGSKRCCMGVRIYDEEREAINSLEKLANRKMTPRILEALKNS